jgi:multidrug efflux pump subunit AcrB
VPAFSNAEVAAQVADKARELLQKYVTQYKIRKASDKMEFIEGRYNEKKSEL